ncbi:protein bric-a-brac 2 [Drosophila virilis]|uniref:Uncharacterized protein n=1 Tax=Drosophila virilis TaxID=7244 RepID=B4LE21_DROVI|nr:protein bric-a-brac 2 [Drosophila virilis]EDW70064.1 uncharacterized protein Dvir_GJ13592 [Drosophila virilis]
MEHVNTTNARQQQQQQQQLQQHQLEQQQQHSENQQQFCLRWHNHQTSLLSTLPVLLDQSQLTDVTISAEGRLLRAHRVVLSACSSFFMEIFRALEASNHPVIIIPGASFGAIVALLTFMYSGEVNVYEEQIPMLLNLAETLGIKGLADVQNNNLPKTTKGAPCSTPTACMEPASVDKPLAFDTTRTPSPAATPTNTPGLVMPQLPNPTLQAPLLANKLGSPLENFFLKSLQFYPNLLPQPLNFSQTALNKTTELLAKYQQQCQLYQNSLEEEDCYGSKRPKTGSGATGNPGNSTAQQQKDVKRIDKIVENLRTSNSSKSPMECAAPNSIVATSPVTLAPQSMSHFSPQLPVVKSSPSYNNPLSAGHLYSSAKLPSYSAAATPTTAQQASHQASAHHASPPYITPEDHVKLQQHIEQYAACQREAAAAAAAGQLISAKSEPNLLSLSAEKMPTANKPPSNSKLYATCFICHKQLSNQYNLRVHLETHQNVRYACNVCSHVSRSKDALRKHVSYRHPGAPSPCENEARRKRVTKLAAQSISATAPSATATSGDVAAGEASGSGAGSGSGSSGGSGSGALSSNPYLFLPNQFQLAAAAAAVAVAESNTAPSLEVAHEVPVSMKSETDTSTI